MHKVLIVDDERPARDYIAELIAGYLPDAKIMRAENAQKALCYLQADDVDLMFADIEMPGMTGLQMIENQLIENQANGQRRKKQPYTFIITAFRKYEYAVKGFRLGIMDYIEKPLHEEKIYNAVKMYLEKIKTETIEFRVCDGSRRVQINQLLALKTVDRGKVMVYCADEILPEIAHSLKQIHPLLPQHFRYIRRDCIINVREVKSYNLKAREIIIICQNSKYPFSVSRENMKNIVSLFNASTIKTDEV